MHHCWLFLPWAPHQRCLHPSNHFHSSPGQLLFWLLISHHCWCFAVLSWSTPDEFQSLHLYRVKLCNVSSFMALTENGYVLSAHSSEGNGLRPLPNITLGKSSVYFCPAYFNTVWLHFVQYSVSSWEFRTGCPLVVWTCQTLLLQTTWIWLLWEKRKQQEEQKPDYNRKWIISPADTQSRREGSSQALDVVPSGYSQKGF